MLVLTRRPNEKILFPSIKTSVQVVSVKSGAVRLGIEAPREVTVLREEVAARAERQEPDASPLADDEELTLCQINHLLRNWLDVATIGLALRHRQHEVSLADATLDPFDEEIRALRQQMQRMGRQPLPKSQVLLVENGQHGREALARLLKLAGLKVATAGDGSAALNYLIAQSLPDVLLLDMRLPGPCDSPTLVRKIRRNAACAGLKIFGVSSRSLNQSGLVSGSKGIDHWFNTSLNSEGHLHDLDQELADVV